jgi:hypothetical protein
MNVIAWASAIALATTLPALADGPIAVSGHAYEGCSARTPFTAGTVRFVATNGEQRSIAIDSRGFYSLVGLEPGRYEVVLQQNPTRSRTWRYPVAPYNPNSEFETLSPTLAIRRLTIGAGETATVDPPTVDRYTLVGRDGLDDDLRRVGVVKRNAGKRERLIHERNDAFVVDQARVAQFDVADELAGPLKQSRGIVERITREKEEIAPLRVECDREDHIGNPVTRGEPDRERRKFRRVAVDERIALLGRSRHAGYGLIATARMFGATCASNRLKFSAKRPASFFACAS